VAWSGTKERRVSRLENRRLVPHSQGAVTDHEDRNPTEDLMILVQGTKKVAQERKQFTGNHGDFIDYDDLYLQQSLNRRF